MDDVSSVIEGMRLGLWSTRLYLEFNQITYQHRLRLKPPLIRVERMVGRWGAWDPITRLITLNSELITGYRWDAVLEVFKHEIAHQIVSEVYRKDELHGVAFQQACRMLGIAEWAACASGELPRSVRGASVDDASDDEGARLLKKVEKLLALATSANEHEALAAMERVRALYARHNLEQVQARSEPDMVHLVIPLKKKRIDRVTDTIFSILYGHFFVRVVFFHLYDAEELAELRAAEILGTRHNVRMAEYVFHFLQQKIASLWDQHRRATRARGSARSSYQIGLLVGFRDQLARSAPQEGPAAELGLSRDECRALVRTADRQLADFVAFRHPRLVSTGPSRASIDPGAFAAGRAEGARITLNKPIETGEPTSRGRLLGDGR